MIYDVKIPDLSVRMAAHYVYLHHQDPEFLKRIRSVKEFTHTKLHPIEVSKAIELNIIKLKIPIVGYKTVNPWSKAIGYAKNGTIFINERKSFGVLDRAETILHETLHLIGFSHNGNRVTNYNLQSVPYLASNIFVNYLKEIYPNEFSIQA